MADLPKRGDRVRVTWAHQHSSLKVGSEVVLSSHGYAVDPANELYRPTPPPDCVSFMYSDADHRERGSHAVKVEILERAGERDCAQCSPLFTEEPHPCAICKGTRKVTRGKLDGLTPEQCQAFAAEEQAGFARGMRMAVEIAEDLGFGAYGNRSIAYVDELKAAVEKELADG